MTQEYINNLLRVGIMEEVNKHMGKNFECVNDLIEYAKSLEKENEQLKAQIGQLQKINNEQRETLKKVRVALIQERTANIMNYGKGGVEMVDDMFEILKGVTN